MLESLSSKIKGALQKIAKLGSVDEEAVSALVAEIERALIAGDVDVKLAKHLSEQIKKRAFEKIPQGLTRREHVINVVYEELTKILGGEKPEISLKPKKVLLCGLFGSGKTSTAAKLARFYQKKGLRPAVIAADTYRPAAYEQLQQLSQRIKCEFYGERDEKDSTKIVKNALKKVRGDVIIVDSSGRDALDQSLVKEIQSINLTLNPQEKILVIPADIGQAARMQAEAFQKALKITDVIVTKLDATAKGGGALTACYATGAKVKFITVGETPEDLEIYDAKKFVARLAGIPDLQALIEKAQEAMAAQGVDKANKLAPKMLSGTFTMEEFIQQFEAMQQMGPLSQLTEMLGLGGKIPKQQLEEQQEKMKKWKFMIQSMTAKEKAEPSLIAKNPARVKRISKGSGTTEAEVRELLSNYEKIKKMMKKMGAGRLKRGDMSKMMRSMGGFKGMIGGI
jgi:signal recognition particle subunit SRP54